MTKTTITPDVHESLDVHGHFPTQVSLDLLLPIDDFPDADHIGLLELIHTGVEINVRLAENPLGGSSANTVDIGQSNFNSLVLW